MASIHQFSSPTFFNQRQVWKIGTRLPPIVLLFPVAANAWSFKSWSSSCSDFHTRSFERRNNMQRRSWLGTEGRKGRWLKRWRFDIKISPGNSMFKVTVLEAVPVFSLKGFPVVCKKLRRRWKSFLRGVSLHSEASGEGIIQEAPQPHRSLIKVLCNLKLLK